MKLMICGTLIDSSHRTSWGMRFGQHGKTLTPVEKRDKAWVEANDTLFPSWIMPGLIMRPNLRTDKPEGIIPRIGPTINGRYNGDSKSRDTNQKMIKVLNRWISTVSKLIPVMVCGEGQNPDYLKQKTSVITL
jgi:hypothetical protein